jgi:aspartate/methionine/tyrosine aminotransferase
MSYRLSSIQRVCDPPIAQAYAWVAGRTFPPGKPLIDVSQAVPGYPPPAELTACLAGRMGEPAMARYTDNAGIPELRLALAQDIEAHYGGHVAADQVFVTAGCNQAFCFVIQSIAAPGDEVILPLPCYFNHQMWCDMQGVRAVHLPFRADRAGVPDPADAAALLSERTRAIVLVSPNNPTGATYPEDVIAEFARLARSADAALVIDETYRDFLHHDDPPHGLFRDSRWGDVLVHLYSFSKVFCLTGYRVGALVCGAGLLREVAKVMDTVAICAPRIGQEAALEGLRGHGAWRAERRALMRGRLEALCRAFEDPDIGYRLVSAGAYFAYVEHPFDGEPSARVARLLADEQNLLCLPGSMFGPGQERYLRFAFANVEADRMAEIGKRLAEDARAH